MFTLPQVVVDANAAMCAVLIFVLSSHFCGIPVIFLLYFAAEVQGVALMAASVSST